MASVVTTALAPLSRILGVEDEVLAPAERLVVADGVRGQIVAADKGLKESEAELPASGRKAVGEEALRVDGMNAPRRLEREADRPPGRVVEHHDIVGDEIGPFRLGDGEEPLQPLRSPFVVGVKRSDPLARRRVEAGVARRSRATVGGKGDQAHLGVIRGEGEHGRAERVARAIIDDQDLGGRNGLGQGASQGAADNGRHVVGGNDDRDAVQGADPVPASRGSSR